MNEGECGGWLYSSTREADKSLNPINVSIIVITLVRETDLNLAGFSIIQFDKALNHHSVKVIDNNGFSVT